MMLCVVSAGYPGLLPVGAAAAAAPPPLAVRQRNMEVLSSLFASGREMLLALHARTQRSRRAGHAA